jgi:hypothetical protein
MGSATVNRWRYAMDAHPAPAVRLAKHLVITSALTLLTVVAFQPVFSNGFVNWDDEANFLTNTHYRGLGPSQIAWALTTFHLGAYQPLGWALFSAEYCVWRLDPRGYHLVSIILHIINVILLYAIIDWLLKNLMTADRALIPEVWAGMAAAWYAVHPLRVEPVAWISCQSYLPCALFMLITILLYIRRVDARPLSPVDWSSGMLLSYGLALLFKAQAITLPAILIVFDIYLVMRGGGKPLQWFGRSYKRALLNKLPFIGLAIVFTVVAYRAKASTFNGAPVPARGFLTDIAIICYGYCFYMFETLIPRDVAAIHTIPGSLVWTNPSLGIALCAVGGASAAIFWGRRRWPGMLAAWVVSLALLTPAPGLLSLSLQLVANRYTYVAAMVWAIMAAAGLNWLAASCKRRLFVIAMLAAGLAANGWSVLQTRAICRTWRDSESLWTYALHHGGKSSAVAYSNLAAVYGERRETERAIAVYRSALSQGIDQSDVTGLANLHFNLGRCLESLGKLDEAAAHLAEVARIARSANANYHCGRVLAAAGRFEEAIPYFDESLRINPRHVGAREALAKALRSR